MKQQANNALKLNRTTMRLMLLALVGVFAISSSVSVHSVMAATNTLTVTVFQDIDVDTKLDGTDTLLAGITVNVFDADDPTSTACATAVTDGSGVATFAPADTAACTGDQLRVEVDTTTYPAGTQVGPVNLTDDDADANTPVDMDAADDASATVQIVDLSAGDVAFNVAAVDPSTYVCDANNATAMTTCFVDGDPLPEGSVAGPMDAIVAFPYTASGAAFPGTAMTYVEPEHISTNAEVGSVWGLAWSQQTEKVYTSAFLKRHVGLGPLGLDGIYVVDFSTGIPVTSGFVEVQDDLGVDVGQVAVGSNTDRGLSSTDAESHDVDAWAQVALLGLGDIDVVDDEALDVTADGWIDREFLLVTDLQNKDVLVIDTADGSLVMTYDIPAPTPACTNGEHRPWAVNYLNGTMQVGLVCDGSTDVANMDSNTPNPVLEAIVYEYDLTTDLGAATIPAAPTVTPTVAIRYGLDYTKDSAWPGGCDTSSNWHPWRDDLPPTAAVNTQFCWATPVLADIDFTDDGNMLMSFMDRFSHQIGWRNLAPDINDTVGGYRGNSGGDLLMACPDGGGAWQLESNGTCGALTSTATGGPGPGGAEFFGQDNWSTSHPEVVNAGVAVLPGSNEAVVAGMDPYNNLYHSAGGINWFNTQTGIARDPGYMLYASAGSNSPVVQGGTQGKSGGLGDVDIMCPQMPVQIGDYVWYDADKDGVQDPDEIPLPGTTVYLILPSGASISTTTDANGHYYFDVSRNQSYTVAFDVSTTTATLPPGVAVADLEPTLSDSASSTDLNDSDMQGTVDVAGLTLPKIDYTTSIAGASNHTLDAGFTNPSYDLALVKTMTSAVPTQLGDEVVYNIAVMNQGDDASGEFTVYDALPQGLVYVASSATVGTDAGTDVDITVDEASATTDPTAPGSVTWTLGSTHSLESGESLTLEIRATLQSYEYSPLRNEAEIASDSGDDIDSFPDTDLANDNDNDTDTGNDGDETRDYTDLADVANTDVNADDEDDHDPAEFVLGTYDLALVKVITGAVPTAIGETVTFQITVQNQGQLGSGQFTVYDALPAGLVYVASSATVGTDATTNVDIAINEASATTNPATPGAIEWTLGATHELAPSETLTLTYQATLEDYHYQTYRNEAEISSDSGNDVDSYPDTDMANDSDNDADNGNDGDETRDYTDPSTIGTTDTNADDEDDHDPAQFTIGDYDLALVKVITGATPVDLGEAVTFEITVQNQGDLASGTFTVFDALPPGLVYVTGSASVGTDAGTDVDIAINESGATTNVAAPGSITWTLGATHQLLAGESLTLSYQATLESYDYFVMRNEAEISSDAGHDVDSTPDTDMANDSDNDADNSNDGDETRDYVDPTEISNTDTNADDEDDHDPAVLLLGEYDLALVKVMTSAAPTALGDALTFEITVQNQGDLGSSAFSVYDALPAGLVYVSGSATASTDADTDVDINIDESAATTDVTAPGSLTWSLGATHSLMAGETLTLTYQATLESYDYQVMRNEAEIATDSGADVDSYPDTTLDNDNDNDTDTTNDGDETRDYTNPADIVNTDTNSDDEDDHDPEQVVLGDYDLALVKVITGDAPTAVDDTVEYSIVIRNQGDLASSVFSVTDTLPVGMIYVAGSASVGTDADTDVDIAIDESAATTDPTAPGTITWTLGAAHSLLADEEVVLTYELQIKDLSHQIYRNEAEISADSGIDEDSFPDTDTSNDSDNDSDTTNDGDETRDYDSLTNVVDTDSNDDDEDDHDPAVLTLPYDLALVKTITQVPVEAGGIVEYQIRVMNQGVVPSGEFTVIDVFPTGLVYVAGSATTGTDADTDVDISVDESAATTDASAPGTVTWTLGTTHSLEAGETVTLTIQATLEDVSIETFRNEAEITSDSGIELDSTPDTNMANDSDNDPDTSNDSDETRDYTDLADVANTDTNTDDEDDHDPASFSIGFDLALRKTLVTTSVVEPGDEVVFAITVFNQGNIAAYDVEVVEYTPTDMAYVSANVADVTKSANDNDVVVTEAGVGANASRLFDIDTIAAGDSVTFEVTMRIDDDFQGTSIENVAEISDADGDEDPDNDPPTDNDSDPDDDPDNDGDPDNDEIEEDGKEGEDEDDHDPEVVTVGQTYDLALIKTLADGQAEYVDVDDVVDYVLTITNQGTLDSGTFTVTESIPSGMEFVSATGTDFTCTAGTDAVDCVYGASLTPRSTATIDVQLRVKDLTLDLVNVAEISEDSGDDVDSDPDKDPTNDPNVEHDDIDHDDPDYDERTEDEDDHDREVITPVASIGDVVWYDNNYNGLQDVGEPGVENVTVRLYDENDTLVGTTTTNADGFYEFKGLVPGPYYVQFDLTTLPENYTVTLQDTGSDNALDSDADRTTGRTPLTTLDPGEHDPTWDMGIYQPAGLGDYVWLDVDGDGLQDDNESGVENVTVNLLDPNGNVIGTTTTDNTGYYEFRDLLPGDYIVEFIKPTGFGFTFFEEGLDATNDSNADRITGRTPLVSLSAGEFDPTIDAGLATGSVLSAIETEITRRTAPPTPTPTPQPPAAQAANLQPPTLVKSESRTIGTVGDQVTYTLVVTNPNTTTLSGVTVTDTLDSRLDYVSSSSQQGGASYDPASRTVSIAVGNMTANQTVTITIVARINTAAQAPDVITNVAQVIASGTSSIDSNSVALQIIPNQIPTTGELSADNPLPAWPAIVVLSALLIGLTAWQKRQFAQ